MKYFSLIFLLVVAIDTHAQSEYAAVKGRIVSDEDNTPAVDILIQLPQLKQMTVTDSNGCFVFSGVPYGAHLLTIYADTNSTDTFRIWVDQKDVDLNTLSVKKVTVVADPIESLVAAGRWDEGFPNVEDEYLAVPLFSLSDKYWTMATFHLSSLGFKLRGYSEDQMEIYVNGMMMNDLETGRGMQGQWAGLYAMFSDATLGYGLSMSEEGLGGALGSQSLEVHPSDRTCQSNIAYSRGNRNFRNRYMVSHHTGLLKGGLAFSFIASCRLANEGYTEGTFYEGYSWYIGISKKLGNKGMLHLNTYGAPVRSGLAASATEETFSLAGTHFYNPNWGYQNEIKRNARVRNYFQPVLLLNYEYKPSYAGFFNIALAVQRGKRSLSSLDWYNAADPRPDYYQYLPSYWTEHKEPDNITVANAYGQQWQSNISKRQIDWHSLYERNRTQYETVNGITGFRSAYVIGEDYEDIQSYNLSSNFKKIMGRYVALFGGASFQLQQSEKYRKMTDLLGGDYYVDLNQFAERNYPDWPAFSYPDLNQPEHIIREGDRYAYNYIARFKKAQAWIQADIAFKNINFLLGFRSSWNQFGREGLYHNGLFPEDSYGKSEVLSFFTTQYKGGINYTLAGRHNLYINASLINRPPLFDHTFYSPRTRNSTIPDPKSERIYAMESGYMLHTSRLQVRLTAFLTDQENATRILRFFYEGYPGFVNYAMRGINTRHWGTEISLQMTIHPRFTVMAMATWMEVFYRSRAEVSIYPDQDTTSFVGYTKVYMKNYYAAAGPQSAYALGMHFRPIRSSFLSLHFNLLDRNYVEVNPARLTEEAVTLLAPDSEVWQTIRKQDKLPSAFAIDFTMGKSFLLRKLIRTLGTNMQIAFHTGVNNLLDNKNILLSQAQQLRFDFDTKNPEQFPDKYRYAPGRNYFVSMQLKF